MLNRMIFLYSVWKDFDWGDYAVVPWERQAADKEWLWISAQTRNSCQASAKISESDSNGEDNHSGLRDSIWTLEW